jgi:integrase
MTLNKKGGVYHVSVATPQGNKRISTGARDRATAEQIVKESGVKRLDIAAKAGRLTQQAIGQITTGHKLTMSKAFQQFRDWLESIGRLNDMNLAGLPPSAVTEQHVNQWINAPNENGSAYRETALSGIRSFFEFTAAKGWSIGNPARLVRVNMRQLSHEQKEPKEVVPFTKLEINRLIKYTEDKGLTFWTAAVRISRETGLRLGDVARLEWNCFAEPGCLIVWTSKRLKRVAVPISDELQEVITTIPITHKQYVFPEQRVIASDPKRVSGLSVQFGRICAKCEITGKSFHGLRHHFVSELKRQGKTLEEIGKLVGHSDTATTEGYVHEGEG